MDGTEIALRIVGAFYTFAGLVAARVALTSNLLDRALSAITMEKPDRVDTHLTLWLVGQSVLILAGGVMLMLLLAPAAWLFVSALIGQALYFTLLAPYYFDATDPPDPTGRRRSVNAFVIYCAATAFVVWAAYKGRLIPIADASAWLLGAGIAAIAAHVGYVVRHMLWAPKRQSAFGGFDDDAAYSDEPVDDGEANYRGVLATSKRIKVMADYRTHPLWAMDDGLVGAFAPQELGVSDDLNVDLWAWANAFDASLDPDDPANSLWSAERHHQHIAEGLALARRIKRECPDRDVFVHDTRGALVEVEAEA